jgi:hypothetical protein
MAMQSASLLCEKLIAGREDILSGKTLKQVCSVYEVDWRKNFARRTRAASLFANASLHTGARNVSHRLFKLFPALLNLGAKWSGQVTQIS